MASKKPAASAPIDIPSKSKKGGLDKCGSNASEASHLSSNVAGSMSPYIAARQLFKTMSSNSSKPSVGNSRVNIVLDSCSVLPSLASSFSLDIQPLSPKIGKKLSDIKNLGDKDQIASSYQNNLEALDKLEDPAYLDTIQSNDSSASLLRRTLSLPCDYQYEKSKKPLHAREIFEDFMPTAASSKDSLQDSIHSSQNIHKGRDSKMWRQTMDDLLENSEYVDSLESTSSKRGLLAKVARDFVREGKALPSWEEIDEVCLSDSSSLDERKEKKKYMKNLLILSVSFMCTFTSYISLRNLQSSLNHSGGMGLYSLCLLYSTFFFSCIFSTTIVLKLRPKNTLIMCFLGFLIYALCNFYASYYTLFPAAVVAGFCLANAFTAQATYLANIGVSYAKASGELMEHTLSRFNGIFYMIFQSSQVIGGVLSSVVLMAQPLSPQQDQTAYNSTGEVEDIEQGEIVVIFQNLSKPQGLSNFSHCGAGYCPNTVMQDFNVDISMTNIYILNSIFTAFSVGGILILVFLLDPLEGVMPKKESFLREQLSAVFRFYADWKVVLLVPLMLYSLIEISFMFGEFTKAFVTCSTGVYMVGYIMLTIALMGAISSFISGKLMKYTGRMPLFFTGFLIHMCMLVAMLQWKPSPSAIYILFIIAAAWGCADGIFVTQLISLLAVLFIEKREAAFAGLKMCQSLGAFLVFVSAPYLCTSLKIYIVMGSLALAFIGYTTLELCLRKCVQPEQKKFIGPTSV